MNRRLLLTAGPAALITGIGLAGTGRPALALDAGDRTIVPGIRVGAITRQTRPADLATIFGAAKVNHKKMTLAEGEEANGAMILEDTDSALQVVFTDDGARIDYISILGKSWRTASGLRVGTTLPEVEKINGGPFQINGFGWDYGGVVAAGPRGKLPKSLSIVMHPTKTLPAAEYDQVVGDRKLSSRHPILRKTAPAVELITFHFSE